MSKAEYMKRTEMIDIPEYCVEYLTYLQVVRSLSPLTVREYYLDLKTFFRFLKVGTSLSAEKFNQIDASDYSIQQLKTVNLSKLHEYLVFRQSELNNSARSRMRKISSLRGMYKYLATQKMISEK